MFIATVVAPAGLAAHQLDALAALLPDPGAPVVLEPGRAADLPFARLTEGLGERVRAIPDCDVILQRVADRARRLLVSDMDSTMITVECIDELADYAGCRTEVAAVTERAMRGEIDFADALAARVALLDGLPVTTVDECLRERVRPMAGAATLLATLNAAGVRTLLVSGGFTRFAEPVAATLGFERVVANRLEERDGRLTGRVIGPLVDAAAKVAALRAAAAEWRIPAAVTLAVGDGANDLPMIEAAGLGVAFRAKPIVRARADSAITHGDLTVLLHALGIARDRWVER